MSLDLNNFSSFHKYTYLFNFYKFPIIFIHIVREQRLKLWHWKLFFQWKEKQPVPAVYIRFFFLFRISHSVCIFYSNALMSVHLYFLFYINLHERFLTSPRGMIMSAFPVFYSINANKKSLRYIHRWVIFAM